MWVEAVHWFKIHVVFAIHHLWVKNPFKNIPVTPEKKYISYTLPGRVDI